MAVAVARALVAGLAFERDVRLRPEMILDRQKAFLVPGIVPPGRLSQLERVATRDDWDPDKDRYEYPYFDDGFDPRGP